MPKVQTFAWDEDNEEHVDRHGLTAEAIDQILAERVVAFRNKRGARGAYLVVGRDFQGRYLTVIIEPSPVDSTEWRVITAWPSSPAEQNKAKRQGI